MKAILIDTINRNVREVELPDPNGNYGPFNRKIYELLGEETTMMEIGARVKNDVVFVDEEGLFNAKFGCFTFEDGNPLRGNGLVVGGDDEGASADVKLTVEQVRSKVRFGILVPKG